MFAAAAPAHAVPGFAPAKFATISVDARTGQVLYARNADARRYPASLTKVMTLYLAFDALDAGRLHLDDRVRISPHAAAQAPCKLGLAAGSTLSVREALDVIVVQSANDIAVALAEKIGGSEAAFVRRMNAKADALGMKHTHFANASGLPNPRNVSTARDLAILGAAVARNHPQRYALFDQSQTRFRNRVIPGHNALIRQPGIDGLKTGYINASGFNLMTSGVSHGRRVVAVVLGGSTARVRDRYMARLMRASFAAQAARDVEKPVLVNEMLKGRSLAQAKRLSILKHMPDADAVASADTAQWRVQVGAFNSAKASSAKLAEIAKEHPRHFDREDGRVKKLGGLYLARFVADSRDEAEAACSVLDDAGQDCLALVHRPD